MRAKRYYYALTRADWAEPHGGGYDAQSDPTYVDHTKGIPVPDYPRVHLSATGYHFTVVLGYPACVKRRTAALDGRYHRDAAW